MKNCIIIVIALACTIGSCTTVRVVKVSKNGNEQGLRYSLGRPYIQVTPNPSGDGSYSVEVIYLPDLDQTYAVQTNTFLAKNVMEVSVDENGILKKIDWTGTTDATISESTKALGEVAKAEVERRTKEEDEEEKDALAKKQAAEDEVKKLETELTQKKLDRQIAEKDLATLQSTYKGNQRTAEIKEKMRQTRLLIDRIEGEIEIIATRLNAAKTKASELSASFNDPAAGDDETAYGSVLFKIIESYNAETDITTLALKAVDWGSNEKQKQFRTIAKVESASLPTKAPTITTQGRISAKFQTDVAIIEFAFNGGIEKINEQLSIITAETGATNPDFRFIGVELTEGKKVKLTFKKQNVPAGKYTLNIEFSYKVGENVKNSSQALAIELIN